MAKIYNQSPTLGVTLVANATQLYNNQPVIGIRRVDDGVPVVDNLRILGVDLLAGGDAIHNEQLVRGAVMVSDGQKLFNNAPVLPVNIRGGDASSRLKERYMAGSNAFSSFVNALLEPDEPGGYSPVLVITSDSTGSHDDTGTVKTGWPYLLAQRLAALFSSARVEHYFWDDVHQEYNAPDVVQAGSAGRRCAVFGSISARSRQQTAASVGDWSGDLDVRINVKPVSWQPAATQTLICRCGTIGTRGWIWTITAGGGLTFQWWFSNASDANALTETVTHAQLGSPVAGTPLLLRVTVDIDNGAGGHTTTFYYSKDDGATWTVAKTSTVAGTTTILAAAGIPYEIGARAQATNPLTADVYDAQVRDGIGGPILTFGPIDSWIGVNTGASITDGSKTIYIYNGSIPAKNIAYFSDPIRFPKLVPRVDNAIQMTATGYNEATVGAEWIATLEAWAAKLKARNAGMALTVTTQGPMTFPGYWQHAQRQRLLLPWATRAGQFAIDGMKAMRDAIAAGAPPSGDAVHPSAAMMAAWANLIYGSFSVWR